eukprot:1143036-Pelagomonas_calceolata.AAC.6
MIRGAGNSSFTLPSPNPAYRANFISPRISIIFCPARCLRARKMTARGMSGQERPPTSPAPPPPTHTHTAAPCTAAPSLLAAPQVLHKSSPHHAASAGQAHANKGQAFAMEAAAAAAVRKTALAAVWRAAMTSEE